MKVASIHLLGRLENQRATNFVLVEGSQEGIAVCHTGKRLFFGQNF
jgi:hypothetical protein